MQALLDLASGLPQRVLAADEVLLAEGDAGGVLYILLDGGLRVVKRGTPVAAITEPGMCVGEISLLLDVPTTADVVATEPTVVAMVADGKQALADHPSLARTLAELLAARVQRMTTYLADLQRQYADHEGGLGMVDVVLGSLMHHSANRSQLGSDRDPEPEY